MCHLLVPTPETWITLCGSMEVHPLMHTVPEANTEQVTLIPALLLRPEDLPREAQ